MISDIIKVSKSHKFLIFSFQMYDLIIPEIIQMCLSLLLSFSQTSSPPSAL